MGQDGDVADHFGFTVYPDMPRSTAAVVAGLVVLLGIVALVAVASRD